MSENRIKIEEVVRKPFSKRMFCAILKVYAEMEI